MGDIYIHVMRFLPYTAMLTCCIMPPELVRLKKEKTTGSNGIIAITESVKYILQTVRRRIACFMSPGAIEDEAH